MAPLSKTEFVVFELEYMSALHPEYPVCRKRRTRTIEDFNINTQRWFDRCIRKELSKIACVLKLRYYQLKVLTGDVDLFTICGNRFSNIVVILGEVSMYWLYYQNSPHPKRLEGCSRLIDNFCSCCMPQQYLSIMQSVRNCIMKTEGGI